ncbi:MAG: hypothetical protein WCX12_01200 [Candidatus Paceibacterota bacterium]
MTQKTDVHGFVVVYEENSREGVAYLRDDLDLNEARVFFDQAKIKGSAEFEDDDDRPFTLSYHDGEYTLIHR